MTQKDGGGMRFNAGKTRYGLIPESWTRALAEVLTRGAVKYAPNNWKRGMDPEFMVDSLQRHLAAYRRGEKYDPESGNHHLAHAAWNALALMTYDLEGMVDDEFFEPKGMPTSLEAPVILEDTSVDESRVAMPDFRDTDTQLLYWRDEKRLQSTMDALGLKGSVTTSMNYKGCWMMNSGRDDRAFKARYPEVINKLPGRINKP